MNKKLALFSLFIFLLIVAVPIVTTGETLVIDEGKAWGYHYSVTKDQDTFTWEIGHQDVQTNIIENKDNSEDLLHFRTAINDIQTNTFSLIISSSYLFLVLMLPLFLLKINKKTDMISVGIITVFALGGLFFIVTNSFALNSSIQDANFYYSILMDRI
ncbi:geobacillin-26 family protein [Evansella sp. AB-rgal1]|uniref:geobacillin-26 family protein n=1 Tax=Evansella sp. AB-rgal1 TaxID=3242696 RepID=UPI00359DA96B